MYAKLFVGSLPWSVDDAQLEEVFQPHGRVQRARVIIDRDTGRSRGFGFVEIEVEDIAKVINDTNGLMIGGRAIRVNEAEEQNRSGGGGPRRGGGGGGGGRGGSGGRGGGGGGRW